ncbi:hypothetical protein GCM10027589_37540 [Actinocorallia lasiicapitis]
MSSLWNQLPTLIGVIVGALASYLATNRNETARWKRQQAIRWDAERRAAYATYAHAVKALSTQCGRLAAARGATESFFPIDLEEGLPEYRKLSSERGVVWESVLLLGTEQAIDAGRAWHSAVAELQKFADGRRTDYEQWEPTFATTGPLRDAFYEAARTDLVIER